MIKLMVSDLDGTLLDHDKKVREREKKALLEAGKQGMELCLASGRMPSEMKRVAEEVGLPAHIVSLNGAFVFTKEGRLLKQGGFSSDIAVQLLQAAPANVFAMPSDGKHNFVIRRSEAVNYVEKRLFAPIIERHDLTDAIAAGDLAVCKISYFGQMEDLKKLQTKLEHAFAGTVTVCITDKDCLDAIPQGISKGEGLRELLKELGLRPEEAACIGDAFNDVPMFEVTPYSFAMACSDPLVRQAATRTAANVAEAVEWAMRRNQQESREK